MVRFRVTCRFRHTVDRRAADESVATAGRADLGRLDIEPTLRTPERLVKGHVDLLLEVSSPGWTLGKPGRGSGYRPAKTGYRK